RLERFYVLYSIYYSPTTWRLPFVAALLLSASFLAGRADGLRGSFGVVTALTVGAAAIEMLLTSNRTMALIASVLYMTARLLTPQTLQRTADRLRHRWVTVSAVLFLA